MSALIKYDIANAVNAVPAVTKRRRLGRVPEALAPALEHINHAALATIEAERLRQQVDQLTEEVARLHKECEEREAAAYKKGLVGGTSQGRLDAQAEGAAHLDMLSEAISATLAEVRAQKSDAENLAIDLTRLSLQRIVGDVNQYGDMVTRIVHHQLEQLDASRVARIEVSALDFPESEQTRSLLATAADYGVEVVRDSKLPHGACHIRLSLGSINASVTHQLTALDRLLSELPKHE